MSQALSSISDVDRLEFAIAQIELLNDDFAMQTLSTVVNVELIDLIQSKMEAAGISKKIIQNTYLEKIVIDSEGEADIYILSDYTSDDGFDVARAREHGTKDHPIKPTKKKALSFILNGVRLFSKGHTVSGLPSLRIIEKTVQEVAELIQQKYYELEEAWATSILYRQ